MRQTRNILKLLHLSLDSFSYGLTGSTNIGEVIQGYSTLDPSLLPLAPVTKPSTIFLNIGTSFLFAAM